MFFFGIILTVIGTIFAIRWFSEHSFEYLNGVKPSEQIDSNFIIGMVFLLIGLAFLLIWCVKTF